MDLKSVVHHIRVKSEDIEKILFNAKYNHYVILKVPMDLSNSPGTFQTLLNLIFKDSSKEYLIL